MMGGGAPQTFSQGGNPAPYVPMAQPQFDKTFQYVLNQFPLNPVNTPTGQQFPVAQQAWQQFINPYGTDSGAGTAIQGAQTAAMMGEAGAPQLQAAGTGVLNTAFDPQQALYNRTLGQTLDQASVANAMAGIGGTPYGASNIANQARNFGIDWQNNLLNRQIAGGQAGTSLLNAAPTLAATAGMAPFNAAQQIGQNTLQGTNALNALWNTQFGMPQQVLNDIQSYLDLGQAASANALYGGNLGFNQTAQGIGGLLGGANALFGGNGLFSSGGLFGGGSSALGGASALGDLGGATTFATDTTAPIASMGAGDFLSSAAPSFALS